MADISADQAAQTQEICAVIESCRLRLQNIARNLTTLVKANRATCEELRAYNLWALSVYQENKAQIQVARAAGATGLPLLPPSPTLFKYKGLAGDQALNFPCDQNPQTLAGALAAALAAPANNVFVPGDMVEVIPADMGGNLPAGPSLTEIQSQLNQRQLGELGAFPWTLVIVGIIVVASAAAIVAVTDLFKTQSVTTRTVKVSNDNLKIFETAADLRAKCLTQCIDSGGSPESCTSKCANVIPVATGKLPGDVNSDRGLTLGFWTWFLIGTGAIVGGRYALKRWKANRASAED